MIIITMACGWRFLYSSGASSPDQLGRLTSCNTAESRFASKDSSAAGAVEASSGSYSQGRGASINVQRIADSSSTTCAFSFDVVRLSSKI